MRIDVNDLNFDKEVLEKSKELPVVVDFWAPWCAPCRMLKPLLEKLSTEFDGKFVLAKLNVEEHNQKASQFGVMSIPAVKMFKDGKIIDEFVGAVPEPYIRQWLENNGISK